MTTEIVSLEQVNAEITLGNGEKLQTVKDVDLRLYSGRSYAVVGKSGSGKTSLVSIIGLLNRRYTGALCYQGRDVAKLSDRGVSRLRAEAIGFVFQNYSLIQHLSVQENIGLALQYCGISPHSRAGRAEIRTVLELVGLADRAAEFPNRLSGGEQQRVAIARALVVSPELLICDEPTGALDTETSDTVMSLLQELVLERGTTLLLVTHDPDIAQKCDTVFTMIQGELVDAADAH